MAKRTAVRGAERGELGRRRRYAHNDDERNIGTADVIRSVCGVRTVRRSAVLLGLRMHPPTAESCTPPTEAAFQFARAGQEPVRSSSSCHGVNEACVGWRLRAEKAVSPAFGVCVRTTAGGGGVDGRVHLSVNNGLRAYKEEWMRAGMDRDLCPSVLFPPRPHAHSLVHRSAASSFVPPSPLLSRTHRRRRRRRRHRYRHGWRLVWSPLVETRVDRCTALTR